jgi:hypothetical protein
MYMKYSWWKFDWAREATWWSRAGSQIFEPFESGFGLWVPNDREEREPAPNEQVAYTAITALLAQMAVLIKYGKVGHWQDNSFDARNYVYSARDFQAQVVVEYVDFLSVTGFIAPFVGDAYDMMRSIVSIMYSLQIPCVASCPNPPNACQQSMLWNDANALRTAMRDMLDGFFGVKFLGNAKGEAPLFKQGGIRYLIANEADELIVGWPAPDVTGCPGYGVLHVGPTEQCVKTQTSLACATMLSENPAMLQACEAAGPKYRRGVKVWDSFLWEGLQQVNYKYGDANEQQATAALMSPKLAAATRLVFSTAFFDGLKLSTGEAMKRWAPLFKPLYMNAAVTTADAIQGVPVQIWGNIVVPQSVDQDTAGWGD